ncbi:MAG TPA: pyridoxamine 5'-phosphate oxidase family protein [Trebonia sp.]|nr:pyridoxamine 5'-phosphate oxidase family protein [Trebonia sp.]
MPTPVTTFDQTYSDPAASAVDWAQTRRALETAELFWISTVRADGRPHVTPVVAAWTDDAIWFSTGATEQKFANLRANPHVVLTTGCNRWDRGLDVVARATDRLETSTCPGTISFRAAALPVRIRYRWD